MPIANNNAFRNTIDEKFAHKDEENKKEIAKEMLEKALRHKIRQNNPDLQEFEIEPKIKDSASKETKWIWNTRKELDNYMSDKAEVSVEQRLYAMMYGRPGLLKRGLKCENKKSFSHLKEVLGDIAPNCETNCGEENHFKECYQREVDLVMVYTSENKLHIVICEVKRSEDGSLNNVLVTGAWNQIVKAIKFVLMLIPDIPRDKIDLEYFVAFPESSCQEQFCEECFENILSKEDFDKEIEHLESKLKIEEYRESEVSNDLLLTATSRLIGHESIEDGPKVYKECLMKHEENMDQLILLDSEQSSIIDKLDEKKHFALAGGSGTGKTIAAIHLVKSFIQKHIDDGHTIAVYALVVDRLGIQQQKSRCLNIKF